MKIVYWLNVENSKKKIDYWLNVDWFRRTKKLTIDCHYRWFTIIFANLRYVKWKWNSIIVFEKKTFLLTQIHDHFRWFTMRIMKVKYNHRFQKENFKRWRFSFDLRIFTNDLKISNRRFSLNIRVFLRTYLTILFYLFAYFDEQFVSTKRLNECQLISQNSKRKICCAKNNESSSLRLIKKFRAENKIVTNWIVLKTKSSQIDNDFVFFYSLIVTITNVKFTSFVTMKIKYNVKRMFRKQIT